MTRAHWILPVGFVMTVWAANWMLDTYGIVAIGFGLMAPAGVYAAGLGFTLRDLTHERLGREWVIIAILAGAFLSWWIEPTFAVASGVAFLVSELADMTVYTPLRKRSWLLAVAMSNTIGLVVDSALFLWLAFGSLDFIEGQIVGKAYMTAAAIIVMWSVRLAVSIRRREPEVPQIPQHWPYANAVDREQSES